MASINVWQHSVSDPVLQFKDDSNDTYKATHVIVRSAMFKDGVMKVHKVMELYSANPANTSIMLNEKSTPSCLALYVRMCKDCAFHIATAKVYTREMVENATENWQRIVLKNNASERITEISIRTVEKATSKNEKFWYISGAIQGCKDDDWECPTNTIGKNCLPCNILVKETCGSGRIYYTSENNTFCSCSAGYKMNAQSKDCTDQCLPGTYGHNCKRQCRRCANRTCNNVDGSCECEVNFTGKTCNQPILPIVKKAPTLIMAQQQKLQINLNLEYDGQLTATHYQIQYKQQGREWRNGIKSEYQSAQGTLDVNDLTPNTNYWIRVILHVKDNRVYDGNHIPILITKTVCADLNKPSIYLTQLVTSNSTSVAVMYPRKEVCHPLLQFRVCLSREFMLECHTLDNTASFNDLDYYTDYKVELQKNEITTSTWTIQTNEGPPEQVQNVRHGKTTNTNIELVWDVPKKKNGKIMGYRVQYYRTSNKACPNMTQVESQSNTINVEGNSALIDNLEPYSTYEALIWAFTTYEGSPNTFKFDTMESSTLMKQEFPKPTYTSSKDTLDVHFQWNCSTWGGPAIFAVNLVCKSPWCNGSTEKKLGLISFNTSLPKSLKFSTISYTNYTVMMSLERNNVSISKNSLFRKGPSERKET
ncbi:putative axon guidance receptor [Trypoxylus dichotomus]